jgi:hypothetical protein
MMRYLFGLTALAAVIAAGIVHGVWTDRWGTPLEPTALAARLDQLPLVLGEWQGQDLDYDRKELGPVAGSLYRGRNDLHGLWSAGTRGHSHSRRLLPGQRL